MACCLMAQAITWTNVDWSSVKSSDLHIRAISQEMPQPSISKICLKITCLKFHSNFPGANELKLPCLLILQSDASLLQINKGVPTFKFSQDFNITLLFILQHQRLISGPLVFEYQSLFLWHLSSVVDHNFPWHMSEGLEVSDAHSGIDLWPLLWPMLANDHPPCPHHLGYYYSIRPKGVHRLKTFQKYWC